MIAIAGDAEFDEGNVFEALLEAWKHHVTDVWWIIDYNRQSLDAIVADRFFHRLDTVFETMEWRVVTLKYGHRLEAAFTRRGGGALRRWIDDCPNSIYSALAYQGGAAWRSRLVCDLGDTGGIRELLDEHDDEALHGLMTNLAGHDLDTVREAFHRAARDDVPTCFIAYTIKGHGLPFEGHKDNHAGLTNPQQIAALRDGMGIAEGEEWDPFAGLDVPPGTLRAFLDAVPFNQSATRRHDAPRIAVPAAIEAPPGDPLSTQAGFGRVLADVARRHPDLADRIVTTSPDVTVSTNLGGWVNRRGVFARSAQADAFRGDRPLSAQDWTMGPKGQHLELGIAENNLFVLLAALGLTGPLFGTRLLPVGTLYDPFISRGLDALNYACYQDARFILVATPSGVSLAPEGGAHQSVLTPLIGMGQPGLTSFEPAYVDELAEILRWSFEHIQADAGGAVYLRLSTRPLAQPRRGLASADRAGIVDGGYWLIPPAPGAELAIVVSGPVVVEAAEAHRQIAEDLPGAGVLVVTSADRLQQGWMRAVKAGRPERRPRAAAARTAGPHGGARHRPRRAPRDPVLARVGGPAPGAAPRGHPVRPVGRHPRPLPGVRARRRRHPRRRGAAVRLRGMSAPGCQAASRSRRPARKPSRAPSSLAMRSRRSANSRAMPSKRFSMPSKRFSTPSKRFSTPSNRFSILSVRPMSSERSHAKSALTRAGVSQGATASIRQS